MKELKLYKSFLYLEGTPLSQLTFSSCRFAKYILALPIDHCLLGIAEYEDNFKAISILYP
jgi:hypothetical protein